MRPLFALLAVVVVLVCFTTPALSRSLGNRGPEKSLRSALRRSTHAASTTFSSASSSVVDVDMVQSQIDAFLLAANTMFESSDTVWTQTNLQDACRTPYSVTGVTGCTLSGYPTGLTLAQGTYDNPPPSTYTLSPHLGALSELTSMNLDLNYANYNGTLPTAWSTLTKLQNLTIRAPTLDGAALPEEWSAMTSLQRLDLNFRKYDSVSLNPANGTAPLWVSNLKVVELHAISIGPSNDLPDSWFSSNTIIELYLSYIYGTARLPSTFTTSTVMESLSLGAADFKQVVMPSDFSTMTSLKHMYFFGDFIGSLPAKYPPNLERASFNGGLNLTGTIPQALFDCPNLVFLELFDMGVYGDLPAPSSPLTSKFWGIEAGYLALNGTISTNFFHMPSFEYFDVDHLGPLSPGVFGPMPSAGGCGLAYFDCRNCSISGSIPSDLLTACPKLEEIFLDNNYLTGTLPQALFETNTTSISNIYLAGNYLTGTLPQFIDFPQKIYLDLTSNRLTGTIPMGWTNKLNMARFSGNGFDLCGAPDNTRNFSAPHFLAPCELGPQYGYDYCSCYSLWSTCQSLVPCDGAPFEPSALPPYELPPFSTPPPNSGSSPSESPSATSPNDNIPSNPPSSPNAPNVPSPTSTPTIEVPSPNESIPSAPSPNGSTPSGEPTNSAPNAAAAASALVVLSCAIATLAIL